MSRLTNESRIKCFHHSLIYLSDDWGYSNSREFWTMPSGAITTKQLLYLVGLQRYEKEQQMVRDYLYLLGKITLDQLTKEEASELIMKLINSGHLFDS